jgi:hypothetical protein
MGETLVTPITRDYGGVFRGASGPPLRPPPSPRGDPKATRNPAYRNVRRDRRLRQRRERSAVGSSRSCRRQLEAMRVISGFRVRVPGGVPRVRRRTTVRRLTCFQPLERHPGPERPQAHRLTARDDPAVDPRRDRVSAHTEILGHLLHAHIGRPQGLPHAIREVPLGDAGGRRLFTHATTVTHCATRRADLGYRSSDVQCAIVAPVSDKRNMPALVSASSAARTLGVSRMTVHRMARDGRLSPVYSEPMLMFAVDDVIELRDQRRGVSA